MADVYFENVHTKERYKVVGRDEAAGTITLTGRHNRPFVVNYDKPTFEKMGYRPVVVEGEAQMSPPAPAAPPPPPPVDAVVVG